MFVLGAVLGTVCDGFHSHAGILWYPHEWLPKMAWWVPPLFGTATVAIAISHLAYDRYFRLAPVQQSWGDVAAGIASFAAIYAISAFLPASSLIKTAVMSVAVVLMTLKWRRSIHAVPLMFLTAVAGCLAEITLSRAGLFYYTHPDFLGIQMWLPLLYAAASIAVGNWARKIAAGA